MRQITLVLVLAAVVATTAVLMVDRDNAAAQNLAKGCASLTWDDWIPYIDTDHIDEYDPEVVTPVNYIMIDEARNLVWFSGKIHGRDGFTECALPDPPHTPTPIPTATPTLTATPVLIGCRWPDDAARYRYSHDFSSYISPDYQKCLDMGGTLEYEE